MGEYIENCVARLRREKNLTQEQLGQKVGVTRQTIIAIEKGRYTPSVLLALKIAQCLKQPLEDVFRIKKD